jgi:hypothetical protein
VLNSSSIFLSDIGTWSKLWKFWFSGSSEKIRNHSKISKPLKSFRSDSYNFCDCLRLSTDGPFWMILKWQTTDSLMILPDLAMKSMSQRIARFCFPVHLSDRRARSVSWLARPATWAARTTSLVPSSMERDLRGSGGRPPKANWPNGSRIALQFVINYEEGLLSK